MINSKKMVLLVACLFMVSVADAKIKKTKKLQGLVIPSDPSYFFALNDGTGIQTNPGANRPLGAYYITSLLLFPGNTIDVDQVDYSVDKHGNPINPDDNIGIVYVLEHMVQTVDFNNPPASGTIVETSEATFVFNHTCYGENIITCNGISKIKTFPPQPAMPIFKIYSAVTGASGCNEDRTENKFKAKIYVAQSGLLVNALVNFEFDEEIEYKK